MTLWKRQAACNTWLTWNNPPAFEHLLRGWERGEGKGNSRSYGRSAKGQSGAMGAANRGQLASTKID
jgi:hypothetical protein